MAKMSEFGRLEMEFRQGALSRLFPNVVGTGGACLALAANWLHEKKQGTGITGTVRRAVTGNSRAFVPPDGGRGGARQLALMQNARAAQTAYEQGAGYHWERIGAVFEDKGLRVDTLRSDDAAMRVPTNVKGSFPVVLDVPATFVTATDSNWLPRGKGVCIAITFGTGLHAVAAYRSHGSSLYFFDPNIGVYWVADPAGFFAAWQERCVKAGYPVGLAPEGPFFYV